MASLAPSCWRRSRSARSVRCRAGSTGTAGVLILVGVLLLVDPFTRLASLGSPIEPPFVG